MRFYQKRDFKTAAIYLNAVNESRRLKPSIPIKCGHGIPIKHEIEFEYIVEC